MNRVFVGDLFSDDSKYHIRLITAWEYSNIGAFTISRTGAKFAWVRERYALAAWRRIA